MKFAQYIQHATFLRPAKVHSIPPNIIDVGTGPKECISVCPTNSRYLVAHYYVIPSSMLEKISVGYPTRYQHRNSLIFIYNAIAKPAQYIQRDAM